ncbi:BA75_02316T0 [Komagataella pastoris]|uniref:BA75_02316T0 n=1 Tax=Komagataella pastoris TaxID=4922 RepID=A0A1B2JAH1_PICPA|nr:BA75_02316T0 [Komagataella pastoris]
MDKIGIVTRCRVSTITINHLLSMFTYHPILESKKKKHPDFVTTPANCFAKPNRMRSKTCDGDSYVLNLAIFLRSHERQLANALLGLKRSEKLSYHPSSVGMSKPIRLSLTPHHLFYLLERLQELGIVVGPMHRRLQSIDTSDAQLNYVSFLSDHQSHYHNKMTSDTQSVHSISSVKSVMSSVSALWNNFGMGFAGHDHSKTQLICDLKYIFSALSKLPCLRIAPDSRALLVAGYEEYPFDTRVPLKVFKNLTVLEVCGLDPREVCGWAVLSEQLRFLIVKNANLKRVSEILYDLVDSDTEDAEETCNQELDSPIPMSFSRASSYSSPALHSSSSENQHTPPDDRKGTRGSFYSHRTSHGYTYSTLSPMATSRMRRSNSVSSCDHKSLRDPKANLPTIPSSTSSPPFESSTTKIINANSLYAHRWAKLKHLSLAENKIPYIEDHSFSRLVNLTSLDLSNNRLEEVPKEVLTLQGLKSLNLSFNQISCTQTFTLGKLKHLTLLNLRNNVLSSLEGLEDLGSLSKLDLRGNRICQFVDVKPLLLNKSVSLRALYLIGNPIAKIRGYRVTLFNLFNGVEYGCNLKIDGSSPGIFESRLLADADLAKQKLNELIDQTIINRMTKSVSKMNVTYKSTMTHTIGSPLTEEGYQNPDDIKETLSVLTLNNSILNSNIPLGDNEQELSLLPPSKPFTQSGSRFPVNIKTPLSSTQSASGLSTRFFNDDKNVPVNSNHRNSTENPIRKVSIAAPAVPVITTATTTIQNSLCVDMDRGEYHGPKFC